MSRPKLIAFDCFGTLVTNENDEWVATFDSICQDQGFGVDGLALHREWGTREVNFRKTRTNMASPPDSPPFRTYFEAWRDAFRDTFTAMGLEGDADVAAGRCIDAISHREAFPEVSAAIATLNAQVPLAVMSNADDRFLYGTLDHNGWAFDPVISSEAVKAYKPDPRAFQAICTAADVSPEDVLYVGDSPYDDTHGAKLVGMRTVLINRDQRTPGRTPPPILAKLHDPDFLITEMTELPAILESLG
jgi:2-haloacid dehalogenase